MSALLLAYPVLLFLSARWQLPWLGAIALLGLGTQLLWPALRKKKPWALSIMLMLASVSTWVVVNGDSRALLQLAPVMIFLMLAVFFGRTLMVGSTPLVARIAAAARDIAPADIQRDMAPELQRYTRRVTAFWAMVFVLLAIEDLLMLWLALPMPWPLFVNLANFALILGLLITEYLYHSRRYPNPKHHNFLDFVRDVAKFDYHSLLDD